MKIEGQFKDYAGLLAAYNITDDTALDDGWKSFLKKAAGQRTRLTNYSGLDKTFDTAYIKDDPNQPGQDRLFFPDGIERRYANNLPIRVLDSSQTTCDDCDETIFCTGCGFQVDKSIPYDMEPLFSWGDLYDGNCTKTRSNAETIHFTACKDGLIWCPKCRSYHEFVEVGTTLP